MNRNGSLAALVGVVLIGMTGFGVFLPIFPFLALHLGASATATTMAMGCYSLGQFIASPFWGRLADRYGRKIMVERSLVSFVFVMGAMAYVRHPSQVFALRALQGFFAGYGSLALTMAADSAPREKTAYAIGFVQTAQRLGPVDPLEPV